MTGDAALLGSFVTLKNHLHSKSCHLIGHLELPDKLLVQPSLLPKRHAFPDPTPTPSGNPTTPPDSKRIKKERWLVGTPFEQPMKTAKFPSSLSAICKYCGISKAQLVPNNDICQGFCCAFKNCKFKHVRHQNQEATTALHNKLQCFVDNAMGLLSSK